MTQPEPAWWHNHASVGLPLRVISERLSLSQQWWHSHASFGLPLRVILTVRSTFTEFPRVVGNLCFTSWELGSTLQSHQSSWIMLEWWSSSHQTASTVKDLTFFSCSQCHCYLQLWQRVIENGCALSESLPTYSYQIRTIIWTPLWKSAERRCPLLEALYFTDSVRFTCEEYAN